MRILVRGLFLIPLLELEERVRRPLQEAVW
jgi:hypothetical protein